MKIKMNDMKHNRMQYVSPLVALIEIENSLSVLSGSGSVEEPFSTGESAKYPDSAWWQVYDE